MKVISRFGRQGWRWLMVLGLALCAARVAAASDYVTLGQAQLGNIFSSSETVQIPLQTSGTSVSWTATDFFGAATGGTTAVDANGNGTIQPALGRLGYFALHVTASRGATTVATADTTFGVLATPAVGVGAMGDSPFGVCTHFSQGWSTSVMSLMARAGIAQFRDEQEWKYIEPTLTPKMPTYTFPDGYVAFMAAAASTGLNPLQELDFENPNYDGGYTPYTTAGNNAYANYADALLAHYNTTVNGVTTPQIKAVEVWNEYNGDNYYHAPNPPPAGFPSSKAAQYTAMLQTTYTAVKNQQPGVKVIAGASVPVPIPWFQSLFDAGALPYMDAADIHPYVDPPEGLETPLTKLQSLMASYNNNVAKPIWVTECGFTDNVPGRQNMASYLVRIMTVMRATGVERAYWYLLFDTSPDYSGLLRGSGDALGPYVPSAGFPAYANLIQQLYGATFVRRETTDSRTRLYLFNRGAANTQVRVLWSTAGTTQVILYTTAPLTVINIMGEATTLQPTNGQVTVPTSINPVYIVGPVTTVNETGRDQLLADSIRDFSGVQGTAAGSWYYGYFNAASTPGATTYVPSAVQPMAYTATSAEYAWTGEAPMLIDQTGTHPGTHNAGTSPNPYIQLWPVRRWQSNVAGNAHFTGYASLNNTTNGDGAHVNIYVDGNQVYTDSLSPRTSTTFDFTAPIQVGSNVDFVADSGPGTDYNYDYLLYRTQLSVPTPTTFVAWQGEYFTSSELGNAAVSGATAAPAGDGVPNLIKYAEGLNPKLPSAKVFATAGVTGAGTGAAYLTLTCRQAKGVSDLTYAPEGTSDLPTGSWTPGGTIIGSPMDNGDNTISVTYRDTTPIDPGASRRFMRMRVTRQ